MNPYPEQAGHADGSGTSAAAAALLEKRGKVTREVMVYESIRVEPQTVWEVCKSLNLPYEVIHPRCYEMKARGILGCTGETRPGPYGNPGEVLRVIADYSRRQGKQERKEKTHIGVMKTVLAHLEMRDGATGYHTVKAMDLLKSFIESSAA